MSDVHVVVGAGGASGRLVVRHLQSAGHQVRAVTRDGRDLGVAGVEYVAADAHDPAAMVAAADGAQAIYHCAMPALHRWLTDFPLLTDSLVTAAGRVGARLVYADDTWMYGRVSGPMTEDLPYRPVSAKGTLRAWLAERMQHAAAAGTIQLSIVRAGELYGPGVRSMIAGNVFGAAHRGRSVHWFGNPDLPITPTFIDDFARTLAAVGTGDAAHSAVWHVPHPAPTTGRELSSIASSLAGTRSRLFSHSTAQIRLVSPLVPLARQGAELVYQFEQPFVVEGSRAAAAFGITPTSFEDGVAATLAAETLRRNS